MMTLTHYTKTAEAVVNILTHGFAWFPNRRNLTEVLLPCHDFSKREPQQFGMISFTENPPDLTKAHCEKYGYWGIVVSKKWAAGKGAQRVIYVDATGSVTEALREIFSQGYMDLQSRINYPDDAFWLMAYENRFVASSMAGATLWANLLRIWEYMEPASAEQEREWRIVNHLPNYSLSESKTDVIQQVSPPQGWTKHMNVVPIEASEVDALVVPKASISKILGILPDLFSNIRLIESGWA